MHTENPSHTETRSGLRPVDAPNFVVCIGASAGGLEALERMFKCMPDDTGMAFVVIQHLSPDFKSFMGELLGRHTKMPVVSVTRPTDIRQDTVYLLTAGSELTIEGDRLLVRERPHDNQMWLPINVFLRALAKHQGERAVAIVLSGTGSDGSLGLLDIRDAGGIILVQTEESAKFDGMPRNAVATGVADLVLPPEEMPAALKRLATGGAALLANVEQSNRPQTGIERIFDRLKSTYDLDFNLYKQGTIVRRIERRLAIENVGSVNAYADRVVSDPAELDLLYKDLLIGVTRFFRDAEAFEILQNTVIEPMVRANAADNDIRVWVPACSSGEEAYSIAILFLEAFCRYNIKPSLRLFASDMHRRSLQIASEGVYNEESILMLPSAIRATYFSEEGGGLYRVVPKLRRCIIFSTHNVLKDPPFTNIDLVSCRNLLIYFQPPAQNKSIAAFYFALRAHGTLFLGPSENLGDLSGHFGVIDRQWKIFSKETDQRLPSDLRFAINPRARQLEAQAFHPAEHRIGRAYDYLLNRFVPTGALVNERNEVLHIFGSANRYLRPPLGRMSHDIANMVAGDLRIALSSGLRSAARKLEKVCFRGVKVPEQNGDMVQIDLEVEPIIDKHSGGPLFLVLFLEDGELDSAAKRASRQRSTADLRDAFSPSEEAQASIAELEMELAHAKESLQATVEELETSNEELQASNEELLASNEELQSTNEELHSVNEELYSVNAEHEQKIRELNEATGDLRNLMQATEIGSIFTDSELRIRLFTPAASETFNLLPQDIGRDIHHITSRIRGDDVFEEIARVQSDGVTRTKRIYAPNGKVLLRRIRLYVDLDSVPAGVILTFVDISDLASAESAVREREERIRLAAESSRVGIWEWDVVRNRFIWDRQMFRIYGLPETEDGTVAYATWRNAVCPEDRIRVDECLRPESAIRPGETISYRIYRGDEKEPRIVEAIQTQRLDANARVVSIVGTNLDVTEARTSQTRLADSEARFRKIIESAPFGIATVDLQGRMVQVNNQFADVFHYAKNDLLGQSIEMLVPEVKREDHVRDRLAFGEHAESRPMARAREVLAERRDGSTFPVDVSLCPIVINGERFVVAFVTDLSEVNRAAERANLLAAIVDCGDDAIISRNLDGTITSWNGGAQRIYGYTSEEAIGQPIDALIPLQRRAQERSALGRVAQGEVVRHLEIQHIAKNGKLLDVSITASPIRNARGEIIGVSKTIRDVTEYRIAAREQRRLEAKMIEAAKLESLGVLAGGVAHDFNNLLTAVLGCASMVAEEAAKLSLSAEVQENLQIIQVAARRASDLCRQLLAYSGRGKFIVEPQSLSVLVEQTSKLLGASISKIIDLEFDLDPLLPRVLMDTTQVRQVLMNLVINAAEAIGESRGRIAISTGTMEFDGTQSYENFVGEQVSNGTYVYLRVEDTGSGILASEIPKIFEPFYSTKFTGRGLGLSAVLGIIRGHRGALEVKSKSGSGTIFTMYLPPDFGAAQESSDGPSIATWEGTGNVLVVDDESVVRSSLRRLLVNLGFEVDLACDGDEAIAVYRTNPGKYRLVVLDLTMPRRSGAETFAELKALDPTVRVLVMSGYHHSDATSNFSTDEIRGFLAKPFDRESLIAALQVALEP